MKRFLFLTMLVFIAGMAYVSIHEKEDNTPLSQKIEQAMRLTKMMEYQDDDYDYIVHYPGFFEQTDDSLLEKGCCRFSFWQDNIEIVQTAFVENNADSLTLEQAIAKYASELHASQQLKGNDYFILSGHLRTDTGQITGRRFYAKFVQHRKLWFVQTLAYPEECEQAMQRLIKEIREWKVWQDVN